MAISTVVVASLLHGCGPFKPSTTPATDRADAASVGVAPAQRTAAQLKTDSRVAAISRAQIWRPTKVSAMDIKTGAQGPGGFPVQATVTCDYLPKSLGGASPKFACLVGADDEVKVKYGGNNAEVYAEVAATRLLWALGFGADRMHPVRVICRGCPTEFGGMSRENGEWIFDPAVIERKMSGTEFPDNSSWSWEELALVNGKSGGATHAHADALKLLAVFMQHTDTKPQQQRILCLDETPAGARPDDVACTRPFLMVNDVGLTFGRANTFNGNEKAMNLVEWAATPVWKDPQQCIGNLPKSLTGTLEDPVIGEPGRAFLAGLLTQLTDAQIRTLFDTARVTLRLRDPEKARSGFATVEEWAKVFRQKRSEIVDHRCA